jgi:hypothetical protein
MSAYPMQSCNIKDGMPNMMTNTMTMLLNSERVSINKEFYEDMVQLTEPLSTKSTPVLIVVYPARYLSAFWVSDHMFYMGIEST